MSIEVRTALLALFACGAMVGCSGDSGDGSGDAGRSFADLRSETMALSDEISGLDRTTPSTLPTIGSTTYDGTMAVSSDDAATLVGDLQLVADFAEDDISGSVTNIVDEAERRFDGSLAIEDGRITRDDSSVEGTTIDAGLNGTLTDPDSERFDIGARIEGEFLGADAAYVAGFVDGTSCSESDARCTTLDGVFIARD